MRRWNKCDKYGFILESEMDENDITIELMFDSKEMLFDVLNMSDIGDTMQIRANGEYIELIS